MSMTLLSQLRDTDVSPWLDGVTRDELRSGTFQALVEDLGVSGVTTNPSLFAKSLAGEVDAYAESFRDLSLRGVGSGEAARLLAAEDARRACDLLAAVHQGSGGRDGWVSLEVDPRLADDARATLAEVRALSWLVDRPNLMVKIPATAAGVAAVADATAEGYSINATLIFSVDRALEVLGAYEQGLVRAREVGVETAGIRSVASLFVSRVDAALAAADRLDLGALDRGAVLPGIANAWHAHRAFAEATRTAGWAELIAGGANPQRLLWASTGVKFPDLDPSTYVRGLALPGTVVTMPPETLAATANAQGSVGGPSGASASETRAPPELDAVARDLMPRLLADGVRQFEKSWQVVLAIVEERLAAARAG